jgi:toxin ParE1/3/4
MRLKQSHRASADLNNIYDYGAYNHGIEAALGYIDDIERRFRLLPEHPRSGRAEDAIVMGLRSIQSGSHRIYYRIDGDTILIDRILHMAADAARWLD